MDPASIIGLAWTAVQIVQMGLKATSKILEIRRMSSTDDLGSLIGPVDTLLTAAASFDDQSAADTSDELTALGRELQALVRDIMATIRDLKIELQKSTGATRRRQALMLSRFWSAATRWQRIKALQEKIKEYQRALETGLLLRICELSNQQGTNSKDSLASIDSSIQDFAIRLSRGAFTITSLQCETVKRINAVSFKITKHLNDGLEEVSRTVKEEGKTTRDYISHIKNEKREAERLAKQLALEYKHKEQLLTSLRFPGMFNKENTMPEAYERTYGWIFDPPEKHGNKWSDFGTWLAQGEGIYWICGKPGAGKSTLMNFLRNHMKRLRTVFSAALPLVDAPICIFLDGVDELQADRRELASWILEVAQNPEVRLCVAGRAYDVFVRAFEGCPSLRLQDLTYNDIRAYVEGCLLASKGLQSLFSSQQHMVRHLVEEVVWRADGAFLWARLAIQALLNGIDQYDSSEELFQRLAAMPPEIEKLYGHIWNDFAKDEPVYKETTIQWFETFFSLPSMGNASLVQFALAVKPGLQKTLCAEPTLMNLQRLLGAVRQVQNQMFSRTRGLLEVRIYETDDARTFKKLCLQHCSGEQPGSNARHPVLCHQQWEELEELHRTNRVSFIHRSAVEFITGLPAFTAPLQVAYARGNPQIEIAIFQANLALRYLHLDDVVEDSDRLMLRTASLVERQIAPDYDFFEHVAELYRTDSALEDRSSPLTSTTGLEGHGDAEHRVAKLFQRGLIARYPLSKSPAAVEMLLRAGTTFAVNLLHFAMNEVKGWTMALGANVSFLLQFGVDIDCPRHVNGWWQKGVGVTLFFLFVQYGFLTGTSLLTPTGESNPEIIAGDIFFDKIQEIRDRSADLEQKVVLTWTGSWFHELGCPDEGATAFPAHLVVVRIRVVDLLYRCMHSYWVRRGGLGTAEHADLTILVFECKSCVWWQPGSLEEYRCLQHNINEAMPCFGAENDPSSPDLAWQWADILEVMRSGRRFIERGDVSMYLGLDGKHPPSDIETFLTWFDQIYERNEAMRKDSEDPGWEYLAATPALLPKRGKYGGVRVVRGPVWGNYSSGL
ncbi:hypothetical protein H2200_002552 [Cladophialophora chaetospira]|uniref:Nephrocystin 3-like N-terminal domain-containing protein n=1 Tax=Cladophialophora chaetospira TaxID=386627 RepID=A0AA38XJ68_9EURO|nr:hypothetical protein H2200_002552 [Cladophialophora chaetospira]